MSEVIIPLALAATSTGAITALRSSIQPPSSISPVLAMPVLLKVGLTTTSGAGSVTLLLEQSVDNSAWTTNSTVVVTTGAGTSGAQSFWCVVQAPYVRANVSAISGTGAAVTAVAELWPAGNN